MICEAYLAHKKTGLSAEELTEITTVFRDLYPAYSIEESSFDDLLALMQKDKKNQNGKINCTLLTKIGQYSIDHICTVNELTDALRYYAGLL